MTVPLPEPHFYTPFTANGKRVDHPYHFTTELQAYGAACRAAALEEAAKACEEEAWRLKSIAVSQQSAATNCKSIGLSVASDKIRRMK
jgi:hypothetical protein